MRLHSSSSVTVSGTELKAQSTTKQKTLEPRWCEVFSFEYTPGSDSENPPVLDVLVEDVDAVRVFGVRITMPCATRHTIHESHSGK